MCQCPVFSSGPNCEYQRFPGTKAYINYEASGSEGIFRRAIDGHVWRYITPLSRATLPRATIVAVTLLRLQFIIRLTLILLLRLMLHDP